jgi:glycosyltransferase involved in cell wall biosynthesis
MLSKSNYGEYYLNKVLLLCPIPPPYAGPEVATEILINNLPRKLTDYVHLKSNLRDENWKKGKFDLEGLYKVTVLLLKLTKILFRKDVTKVYLLLSSGKVGFLRDTVYILLSVLFGKKVILHYRGGNFDGFYEKSNRFQKKHISYVLNKSSTIIVQANILKKMFSCITNVKTEVLYNGLVVNGNKNNKVFNSDKTVLLFIGHIAFSKGFYELITVYKNIYKEYNLELIFAGTFRFEGKKSKTQKEFLKGSALEFYNNNEKIISNEIKEFVLNAGKYNAKYLGIISGDEKINVFRDADLLILPSYTEGFSVTVLEALAHGLPVIVSDVGALPEIIKEDVNGWITKPGNLCNLEQKIILSVNSKNNYSKISANNYKHFRDNFKIVDIAGQFEKILAET